MAFTKLTSDLNIISALSDEPNDSDGLTAAELKAKFDEAAGIIKTFLNESLIDELEGEDGAGNIGINEIYTLEGITDVQAALEAILEVARDAQAGTILPRSVTGSMIAQLTILAENLADLCVTTAKLADGAVTTPKVADGAITNAKTDFSAGLSPAGPIVLTSNVHYFASSGDLPNDATTGQLAFVKV